MKTHFDNFFHLSIILLGKVREISGNTEEEGGALSTVIKPAGVKHSNQFGPTGASILSIHFPEARSTSQDHPISLLQKWRWIHRRNKFDDITGLITAGICYRENPEQVDAFTERMQIYLDSLSGILSSTAKNPPRWLLLVRDHLHDTYRKSVSVQRLAEDVGITPTHLTRCFNSNFGVPVTTYRHRLRVKSAANMLAKRKLSIAQIALDTGFYDQSHFTHIFKAHTGLTPNTYRTFLHAM